MKKILLLGMMLMFQKLMAFEAGQLSLDTPNVLEATQGSFTIRHRFFGEADDFEKLLGSDDGGNMHLTLKYALLDNFLLGVSHTRDGSTNGVGLEYAHDFDWLRAGVHLNGYSFDKIGDKQQSYYINSALQTKNFFEHLNFTMNYGYDAYYEHQILGLGVDVNVENFIPWMTFTQKVSLLGEFY
ncbi:MAG TPA: hypothetical protein ENK82_07060, partial [Campylobacterales bacterium]|nr:hypothetical protein [Campylobacterales bacterium]